MPRQLCASVNQLAFFHEAGVHEVVLMNASAARSARGFAGGAGWAAAYGCTCSRPWPRAVTRPGHRPSAARSCHQVTVFSFLSKRYSSQRSGNSHDAPSWIEPLISARRVEDANTVRSGATDAFPHTLAPRSSPTSRRTPATFPRLMTLAQALDVGHRARSCCCPRLATTGAGSNSSTL